VCRGGRENYRIGCDAERTGERYSGGKIKNKKIEIQFLATKEHKRKRRGQGEKWS
jgi:hypothetical protein